jgi:hypothetical protein
MALNRLDSNSSLNNAVNFANNIKNEIQTIKTTLASNLSNKNISASNFESLTALVNKVNDISVGKKLVSGEIPDTNISTASTTAKSFAFETNLDFTPSSILITFNDISCSNTSYGTGGRVTVFSPINNKSSNGAIASVITTVTPRFYIRSSDISSNSVKVQILLSSIVNGTALSLKGGTWYAFE